MAEKEKRYAGFWQRFKASLIDGIILTPYVTLLSILNSWIYDENSVQLVLSNEIEGIIFTFLFLAYDVIMYVEYNGQTVGKRVTGIRVIMEDGSQITYGKALLRTIGSYTSLAVLGLGYFWVAWDKKKQAWHDKIAQTVVVKV